MKYYQKGRVLKTIIAGSMIALAVTGCGKSSANKEEEVALKECVYTFDKMPCMDQIKGDIDRFLVRNDKIYIYATEWNWNETESDGQQMEEASSGAREGDALDAEQEQTAEVDDAKATDDEEAAKTATVDSNDGKEALEDTATAEETESAANTDALKEQSDEMVDEEDYGQRNEYFYVCNAEGTELTEVFEKIDTGYDNYLQYFDVMSTGDICILYSSYTDDKSVYTMQILDADGNEKAEYDINDAIEDDYVNAMCLDEADNIYLRGELAAYVLDSQGNKIFDIKTETGGYSLAATKEGTVITTEWDEEGIKIKEIDLDKKAFGDTLDNVGSNLYSSDCIFNGAVYSFYINDSGAVYGYDMETQKSQKLLDWVGCNVNASYINVVQALANGNFVASYYDYSNVDSEESDGNALYLMTKVDPSEVADKQQITYAGIWVSDTVRSQAVKFNKSQDKYQIVIKDYSAEDEPYTKMNADLVAGDVPDIIELTGLDSEKYISKGMLEDLYTYMDKDADINKEDFIDNIIEVMETDGKLYHISPIFGLNTLIGRKSDIAGRDHLTLAEVKELEESAGNDAKAFYSDSDTSILYSICESNYNRYIDWKTGECHFKDSDFGDILEYAATYPRADNANYISSGEEEESFPSKIRNKKIIFADCYSMSMEEIELYSAMFDDEIGFIGYPSEEKNGAGIIMSMDLGIYSKSANKEGAWEFIKTMLTTEMTNNFNLYDGFPLRKDSLESIIKAKSTTTSYVDEFGNEITPLESTWGWDDLEVEIKPLTDEQVEMLRELIASADHLSGAQEDIMSIITEEADDYFNGVKSKDEVVNIIQNRVSTYVNENK